MSEPFYIIGDFEIHREGHCFLNEKRIRLLQYIFNFGSVNKASQELRMSYQQAWHIIKEINVLSPLPLVVQKRGGANGGGAELTKYALKLMVHFYEIKKAHEAHIYKMTENLALCNFFENDT